MRDAKLLMVALVPFGLLCVYRAYSFAVTGFFVSDEFGYYYNAIHGAVYGDRWFFSYLTIGLFRLFGVTSLESFAVFLPFYLFFWGAVSYVLLVRIWRLMGFEEKTMILCVLLSFSAVAFLVLSLGFLTEQPALDFGLAGVYLLVSYAKEPGKYARAFFASVAFGFAGGIREPYFVFSILGIGAVFLVCLGSKNTAKLARFLPLLLFLGSSVFFLQYASPTVSAQLGPIASQMLGVGNGINSDVVHAPSPNTTYTFIGPNSTTTFSQSTTINVTYPEYQNNTGLAYIPHLRSALLIFASGIMIGFSPIAVGVACFGLFVVVRGLTQRKAAKVELMVVLMAVASLGSYLVVSYIFGAVPDFLSFHNLSSIIRYSETSSIAVLLFIPYLAKRIVSRRSNVVAFLLILFVFFAGTASIYQSATISNLSYAQNPFDLSYRSPAIQVRDYLASHSGNQFTIFGVPYGWYFTLGIDSLHNYNMFYWEGHQLVPFVNGSAGFVAQHWESFYVVWSKGQQTLPPYLAALLTYNSSGLPLTVEHVDSVFNESTFQMLHVQVKWT